MSWDTDEWNDGSRDNDYVWIDEDKRERARERRKRRRRDDTWI